MRYLLSLVEWEMFENTNLQHTHTSVSCYPCPIGYVLHASAECVNDYGSVYLVGKEKRVYIPSEYLNLLPSELHTSKGSVTIEE